MIFEPLLVPAGHDHEIQFNDDWWMFGSNPLFVWIDNTTRFGIGLGNPRDTIEVIHRMVFDPILFNTLVGEDSGGSLTTGVRNTLGAYYAGYWLEDADDNSGWGYKTIGGAGTGGIAIPATYKYTYISENGSIWGVPLTDGSVVFLDAAAAVNVGGGIVGLPYNNASEDGVMRFVEGDVIDIRGTTNYNGSQTLTTGTTITQLQFTDTFVAETLDGTETVSKKIGSLTASGGHMVQDSSGNLYYGHNKATDGTQYYYITKIEPDGTQTPEYLWLTHDPWSSGTATTMGLAITNDDQFLYTLFEVSGPTDYGYVAKWNLATGAQIWITAAVYGETDSSGYDLTIDEDGNAYAYFSNENVRKFASADGTSTFLTLMGQEKYPYISGGLTYAILVDNDLGIVIGGGRQYVLTGYGEPEISSLYNLAVRTFDDSAGDQVAVGGTYVSGLTTSTYLIGTGMIAVHDDYIYVLIVTSDTTSQIYKYQWDGSSLNEIANAAGPTYGSGIYFDLYGNLVVVNVDFIESTTDRFYFYDTDLTALGSVSPFTTMLRTWDASVGGSWVHGDSVFNGALAVGAGPNVNRITAIGSLAASKILEGADDGLYYGYKAGESVTTHAKGVFIGAYAGCHQTT
jgi:hypothetical protein